jgi:peptidyl-prolyl cis-trans isomerase D
MFESIRKNTRIMALLLGIVVVPAFVLVGVSGYSSYSQRSEVVAEVGKVTITREQWDAAHQAEIQRIQRSAPNVDLKLLDTPVARYATLERLVQEQVLAVARDDQLLTVSDQRLAQALMQQSVIASLRDKDGRLDAQKYRDLLATQGYTPESYEASLRADLSTGQVTQVVGETGVMPSEVSQPIIDAFFERRTIRLRTYDAQAFVVGVNVNDNDVQAYYDAHTSDFQAPEVVDVDYLVLDQDQVAKSLSVDEADLKAYYEQNKARYGAAERRQVSHILIESAADAAEADKAAAKAKAEQVLAQLQAKPDQFAALAKQYSNDPGSADQGGDLGWVDRGTMVKPFEDAAFALSVNQPSALVQTEFGWHIIEVTKIQTATVKPYEQVREQLLADVQKGKARERYAELAEKFSNMVYEQPRSFEAVAKAIGVEVQSHKDLTRAGAAGVLGDNRLLQAIFSTESLQNQQNTDAVEVNNSKMVSARVTRHVAAHTMPFDDVKGKARTALIADRSVQEAVKAGQAALALAQSSGALDGLGNATTVSRDVPGAVDPSVIRAVLKADARELPTWVGIDLGAQGYAVARVDEVTKRTSPAADQTQAEVGQLIRAYASAETQAYVAYLRAQYKTKILVAKPTEGIPG